MLRSKLLWGFVLGVVTSVLLFEGKLNLGDHPLWTRVLGALAAPGTHFATALNTPGSLIGGWTRLLGLLGFACNLVVYVFVWYALIWMVGYLFARRHPYDRENTLVPPLTR